MARPDHGSGKRARTDTVLQLEAAECGAASLAMVLSHFGRRMPLEQLRAACGVSRDGSKASSILKAARALGLEAKGLKAEPAHLRALAPPMIAFVNFCHFLVVEGIRGDRVYLNDPAQGRRTVSMEEFDEMFTGVVLTFRPGESFEKGDTRPSVAASLFRRTRGFRLAVFFVFLTSLALVVPGIITPIFSRVFVDEILVQRLDDWMLPLLAGMGLTALVRFALTELQTWYLTRAETQLAIRGSRELFAHILELPIPFFGARYAGEIADRLNLNDGLSALLTGEIARAVLNTITAIFFFAVMCAYNLTLALLVFAFALMNLLVFVAITRALADGYQKIAIDEGKLSGVGISGLKDIETFKASGSEDAFFGRWAGLHANVTNAKQAMGRLLAVAGQIPVLLTAFSTALVLALGGYEVMQGNMTIGMLVAFQTLAASFSAPITALAGFGTSIQEVRSHTQRIDDVMDHPAETRGTNGVDSAAIAGLPKGHVRLDEVSFGYLPLEEPLIQDLSIDIEAGSQMALVGASGSGKSTVGRLIVGLFAPDEGSILIDDAPLQHWPRPKLAATLAYVDQEIVLFEGSVRDNLTLWDPTIPDAQLMAAAQDAEIHEVITARAGGYASKVEEDGRNFSGGQRQRLEIARALALNPRILVLDEATSALDPVTEHKIMTNIRRRGCTLIVVAHRLSTIRDSDEIIVLDKGVPVERGRHDALLAMDGRYHELIEA